MGMIDGYSTDKHESGYIPFYEMLPLPADAAVCEVGVRDGGSLALWRRLFPHPTARIVGVDVVAESRWPDGTVRVVADQADPDLPDLVDPDGLGFDLVVDDGCHRGAETMATFEHLWPLVRPGRWYIIEDWQAEQLWPESYPGMTAACTTWLLGELIYTPCDIESVTYRPGLVIIRKAES